MSSLYARHCSCNVKGRKKLFMLFSSFLNIFSYHACALFCCSSKAIFEIVYRNSCRLLIYLYQFSQPSALHMLHIDLARSSQKEFVFMLTSCQQYALLFCSWKSMFEVVHRNSCAIFIYSICCKMQSIISILTTSSS